jgi:hypothetical protein
VSGRESQDSRDAQRAFQAAELSGLLHLDGDGVLNEFGQNHDGTGTRRHIERTGS